MATKRDLVEAHAFSRRRLVTAFVSGAPGGREVEPVRPGRTIVGGIALAVLLLLGAVVAGVFAPRTPQDWNKVGLVVSKDDGGLYVITESSDRPVLRPVINVTSAKLILGDLAADPTPLSTSFIQSQRIGEDVGILGAPHDVPAPDRLIGSGWTACTDSGLGIRLDVGPRPDVTAAPERGLVVQSDGDYFVLAEALSDDRVHPTAYRYRLPTQSGPRDNMLAALGLPAGVEAIEVPPAWLALFPAGGDLTWESMGIEHAGQPASIDAAGGDDRYRVGDVVITADDAVVLTEVGPAPMTTFALAVYENLPEPYTPRVFRVDQVDLGRVDRPYADAHWPVDLPVAAVGEACVQLVAATDAPPRVTLAELPGDRATASGVSVGTSAVGMDPGSGALIVAGDWGQTQGGSPFLVDSKGRAYPLLVPAAQRLGYDGVDPTHVPDGWLELFADGVTLSPQAALCPPEAADDPCG
ncbi:MAG: type VII secretion protein EccB [Nocardioidaceae bacterium]